MTETIQLGEISIEVTRKAIKHVHLSVHPPDGRVTLVCPKRDAPRRRPRLRDLQARLDSRAAGRSSSSQARETPRQFVERESHYLWGRRYLLSVVHDEAKPSVRLDHRRITLTVRPGSSAQKRAEVIHEWHKSLLHEVVPALIKKWEAKLASR